MNNLERWIDPRIENVTVAEMRAYLLQRGWKQRPYPRPELLVFQGPADDSGEPILQVLPSTENLADYRPRLVELISSLAAVENRSATQVLDDVLQGAAENGKARGIS